MDSSDDDIPKDPNVDGLGNLILNNFTVEDHLRSLAHRLAFASPPFSGKYKTQKSESLATKDVLANGLQLAPLSPPHQPVRNPKYF
jgi:hypothetical protein